MRPLTDQVDHDRWCSFSDIFRLLPFQSRWVFEVPDDNGAEVTYYNVPVHPLSRLQRVVLLVIFVAVYVRTVVMFFRPAQVRLLNSFSVTDLVIVVCLMGPFIMARFFRPLLPVTRVAWGMCVIMALDVVFFAMMLFGPLGSGHPSLEALGSYYLGLAKLVLIPSALILLAAASMKAEHMGVVALGFVCLTGATLFATYPAF